MWNPFRRRSEKALSREVRFHVDQLMKDYVAEGLSNAEARRRVRMDFGGVSQIEDACRDVRPMHWLSGLGQDVRIAFRILGRNPAFAVAAVLTLGLGIAANTTVFTVANALLLRGLPFPDASQIVSVYEFDRLQGTSSRRIGISYPDFVDIKAQNGSFSDLAMYDIGAYNISDEVTAPERVEGSRITPNLFSSIGHQPSLGRTFITGEDRPGAEPVAIISDRLWQSRYGRAPNIVGREIRVNAVVHTIVGLMPEGLNFPVRSDLWLPLTPSTEPADRGVRGGADVVGRLGEGVSIDQARADLRAIAERLRDEYPDTNDEIDVTLVPLRERYGDRNDGIVLTALFGAAGFVLLIACANLAGLMLARALRRTRETATRIAVGASRWRVLRPFLLEGLILSLLGGGLGLGLATGSMRWIAGELAGVGLPYWTDFSFDYRVFLHLAAVCILTGLFVGIAPALQMIRTDVQARVNDGAPGAGTSRTFSLLASPLVAGEIALTLVLLVGAGLMIRSYLEFQSRTTGIDTESMLTARLILPEATYPDASDRIRFSEELLNGLRDQPDIGPVTLASHAPFAGTLRRTVIRDEIELNAVPVLAVATGYFDATGIGIERGRGFIQGDGTPGSDVAVVSEQFASRQWPGEDAVGERLQIGDGPEALSLTVVGIANSLFEPRPDRSPVANGGNRVAPGIYVPYRQEPVSSVVVIASRPLATDSAVRMLRATAQNLDPDLPLFGVRTVDEYLWLLGTGNRGLGALFSAFALTALVMSLVGIYGVTAYGLSQRSHEIGVRMALGATGRSVLWLVARRGILQSAIGLTFGMAGAWAVSRVIWSRLMSGIPDPVSSMDTLTFMVVPILLATTTVTACLSSARRAAKADPAIILRAD